MSERVYYFSLDIYYHYFQRHYAGAATTITVETETGQRIQFPAFHLRQFVTHVGIRGRFRITLGSGNKIVSLRQVEKY